jgi:hypothetical protein
VPAGYSGTPLPRKLGIAAGTRLSVLDGPTDYGPLLGELPPGASIGQHLEAGTTLVHLFVTDRAVLSAQLGSLRAALPPDVPVWVSWPKKASRVPTTVTEDVIRELALPLGWVDVKVCAVTEVWSGLKLVVRQALRPGARRATGRP